MKRKLILTITIAALLCILFAFTVSASHYFDFSDISFSPSEGYISGSIYVYLNSNCYCESLPVQSEEYGIFMYDDYNGHVFYGFYNVEFWHNFFQSQNIKTDIDLNNAADWLCEQSLLCSCSNLYYYLRDYSAEFIPIYNNYLDELNIPDYHDGYDDGYNIGKTEGYQSGYVKGSNDTYENAYNDGYNEGTYDGYSDGYYDGETDTYDAAADYVENWFTLQGLKQYIAADETLPSKDIFEYEFNHNSVAFKEATYSAGETDGLNASGIAKESILSIVSAPFYFLSGVFNFEIFGVNLFSIISVILTLAVVGYFFKKIKG